MYIIKNHLPSDLVGCIDNRSILYTNWEFTYLIIGDFTVPGWLLVSSHHWGSDIAIRTGSCWISDNVIGIIDGRARGGDGCTAGTATRSSQEGKLMITLAERG